MTIAEKILARASGQKKVSPNEYITAKIDFAMMPENFGKLPEILSKGSIKEDFLELWDPERFAAVIDHRVPPSSLANAENQKIARKFAEKLKVKYFYDVSYGIGHQVVMEKGHVKPGQLVVGYDSHTITYGALNAAATGIGGSEMAYVIQTGELWFKVPETIRFEIAGKLRELVYSKDLILWIAGKYGSEVAQYKAIEWSGSAIDELSMDSRFTMSNMSVELGAKFALFRADHKTFDYLRSRTKVELEPVESDNDAVYSESYKIDATEIEPQVALPHNLENSVNVSDVNGIEIDQAVIASCCNGRIEDMEIAAKVVKGKKINPRVRFYVAPASWEIYKEALSKGIISTLIEAGVMVSNPSCGLCIGYQGVLAGGDKCIAAAPRNFRGRMGSPDAEIYLASPATVAASALEGEIVDPREVV